MLVWGIDCLLTICLPSEQGSEREGRRTLRNTVESRQDDEGWRAVGVLFIGGMDGAAGWVAQRADHYQEQPGQF